MKAELVVEKMELNFFKCPCCGEKISYTHLAHEKNKSFGPWYCAQCGTGIHGIVKEDESVDIELSGDKRVKTLVLLQFSGSLKDPDSTLFIIIEDSSILNTRDIALGKNDYFNYHDFKYNERECPWNYLRFPIIYNLDTDPHGVFKHVKTIEFPTAEAYNQLVEGDSRIVETGIVELSDINGLTIEELQKLFFSDSDVNLLTKPVACLENKKEK